MSRSIRFWIIALAMILGIGFVIIRMTTKKSSESSTMPTSQQHQAAQKLLGVALPTQVDDLHFHKWQPSKDLNYYTAYIKFHSSREDFMDLMQRMKMHFSGSGGEADEHLPAAWAADPQVKLDWWNPSAETPQDAAAKSIGANGWIVAKYEQGYVYLIVTDSGHSEGTPGPW